jgi:hypothetical protein
MNPRAVLPRLMLVRVLAGAIAWTFWTDTLCPTSVRGVH